MSPIPPVRKSCQRYYQISGIWPFVPCPQLPPRSKPPSPLGRWLQLLPVWSSLLQLFPFFNHFRWLFSKVSQIMLLWPDSLPWFPSKSKTPNPSKGLRGTSLNSSPPCSLLSTIPASWLFLKHSRHVSASGLLHLPIALLGSHFLHTYPHGSHILFLQLLLKCYFLREACLAHFLLNCTPHTHTTHTHF